MNLLIAFFASVVLTISTASGADRNAKSHDLPNCIVTTHCSRVELEVNNIDEAFRKSFSIVSSGLRTNIVEQNKSYIHAEVKSKWMHYIDDLELKALPSKSILQIRSESRVGIGDNGVNKKRIDDLAYRMSTNQ